MIRSEMESHRQNRRYSIAFDVINFMLIISTLFMYTRYPCYFCECTRFQNHITSCAIITDALILTFFLTITYINIMIDSLSMGGLRVNYIVKLFLITAIIGLNIAVFIKYMVIKSDDYCMDYNWILNYSIIIVFSLLIRLRIIYNYNSLVEKIKNGTGNQEP